MIIKRIIRYLGYVILVSGMLTMASCKKKETPPTPEPPVNPPSQPPIDPPNTAPQDPATAATIGFFMDGWKAKSFDNSVFQEVSKTSKTGSVFITIQDDRVLTKISPFINGQNANSWMGRIVTEVDLVDNIRNLNPGVIRFPGGSISDTYFWNQKSSPPDDVPASLVDENGNPVIDPYWLGMRTESWEDWIMTVDNYYDLLQQTGSQGLITVNYGYARYGTSEDPVKAAAHLAANWVRYDNGRTKFWEIGNECNGTWEAGYRIDTKQNKDGQPQIITGALYGQHAQVFIDSMRAAAGEIGHQIFIGVYILEKAAESWQNNTDKNWNQGVLNAVGNKADFYEVHSYYTDFQTNASAAEILNTATNNTVSVMNYLKNNIKNSGYPVKPIALDEWNIFSQGSMQQVSFVNGMHAAIVLAETAKNEFGQTSRWDLANGWDGGNDHGLFNIGDEPGVAKWNPRPAFYYMYYFEKMMGDRMLDIKQTGGADVLSYASSFSSGQKAVMIVNKGTSAQTGLITLKSGTPGERYYWYQLTGGSDNGEFSRKVFVNGEGPDEISGGPAQTYRGIKPFSAVTQGGIKVELPARSVIYLVIDK